jgi:diaminohydroxyphosphoribosylaminopyrimidine deaminase/5-amino-6-(5-phosphoribosylamino)uracil reductase
MARQRELDAMRLAIALSAHGLGTTSPNPPVGCVILNARGEIAGAGYHRRKGEPHAEAFALEAAGPSANGGTAVVTLEPCNHVGRTPACRQALLDAHVSRVVIALMDPTSRGEGGAAVLHAAGVDVETGVLADEARLVLGPWLDALAKRRPIVTVAYALTGDGPQALDDAQVTALRAGFDAVLFDHDRLEEGTPDSHGRGSFELPTSPGDEPAEQLMRLYDGGTRTVLLVGTLGLAPAWANTSVVDRLLVYVAPEARDAVGGAPSERLAPSGFRVANVSVDAGHIRVEYVPSDEHQRRQPD